MNKRFKNDVLVLGGDYDRYPYPILYVIQNQETGFQSIPTTNVEELINKYPHFF